jgi:hypothetical protein
VNQIAHLPWFSRLLNRFGIIHDVEPSSALVGHLFEARRLSMLPWFNQNGEEGLEQQWLKKT